MAGLSGCRRNGRNGRLCEATGNPAPALRDGGTDASRRRRPVGPGSSVSSSRRSTRRCRPISSAWITWLQELEPECITGQIIFLPAVNAPAFYAGRRTSPLDWTGEANLNRMFPGNQYGPPTEMIAWFITTQIVPRGDAFFDLHSAGKSIDHHPSVKIRLMGDARKDALQMRFLEDFGAPLGIVGDRVHQTTLSGEILPLDKIYLSTELGGAGNIRPWIRSFAYNGMKRCLRELGVLRTGEELPDPEHKVALKAMQTGDHYIFAHKDGMFEPVVNLGDNVEDGQFAGCIWNLKEPWEAPDELHFNKGGVVFCKRTPALCEVGDTLFFTLSDYEG